MSTNPLLDLLLNSIPTGGKLTLADFKLFVQTALADTNNYHNFDPSTGVVNKTHTTTLLYSGTSNGVYNGNIATDLANRGEGNIRVLDNTKMGRFLGSLTSGDALSTGLAGKLDGLVGAIKQY
jgi:hypothetical protein